MAALTWDVLSEHKFNIGVKNVALWVKAKGSEGTYAFGKAVAWNGVTNITDSPEGAEPTHLYANDKRYATLMSTEELNLSIEAYTYPDEFAACDGSATIMKGVKVGQQPRAHFALAYVTTEGNAEDMYADEILHVVFDGLASPTEKAYNSINDSPETDPMSWEVSTTPITVSYNETSYVTSNLEIKKSEVTAAKFKAVCDLLFDDEKEFPGVEAILEALAG